jgi:hypothetical protein
LSPASSSTQFLDSQQHQRTTINNNINNNMASSSSSNQRNPPSIMGWWTWSYLFDYAACIITFTSSQLLDNLPPFERPFDINDPEISYPNRPNIVTNTHLLLMTTLAPFVLGLLISMARVAYVLSKPGPTHIKGMERKKYVISMALKELHHYLVGHFLAIGLTNLFTNLMK